MTPKYIVEGRTLCYEQQGNADNKKTEEIQLIVYQQKLVIYPTVHLIHEGIIHLLRMQNFPKN